MSETGGGATKKPSTYLINCRFGKKVGEIYINTERLSGILFVPLYTDNDDDEKLTLLFRAFLKSDDTECSQPRRCPPTPSYHRHAPLEISCHRTDSHLEAKSLHCQKAHPPPPPRRSRIPAAARSPCCFSSVRQILLQTTGEMMPYTVDRSRDHQQNHTGTKQRPLRQNVQ
eukprot:GEMP01092747.1.p1 GENE.GEMP01092747.1~~GEMP01092747.1.p1  ORF type:complete len:171 (-),score=0.74 GEMP01092747.1:75-587(-)